MKRILTLLVMLLVTGHSYAEQCFPDNSWVDAQAQPLASSQALMQMAQHPLVFLGEHHANEQHHLWQHEMLDRITSHGDWVLGMESFPRRHQKNIDKWLARQISDEEFLKAVDWENYWHFPFEYYKPLLQLARDRKMPVIALNVDRELIRKTGKVGWKNIPQNEREGVIDPRKPGKAYLRRLAISFQRHNTSEIGEETKNKFKRFVEQQLLWDAAMAQAINKIREKYPERNIVSIIGSWHLIDKLGVPYQLETFWQQPSLVAIPWDNYLNCQEITPGFADMIFTPPQS